MKRIIAFLITFSLLLSMGTFAFATETTELTEVTSLPLTLPLDSDFNAQVGDELDVNTWLGGGTAYSKIIGSYKQGPTLSGSSYEVIIGTDDEGNDITTTGYTISNPTNNTINGNMALKADIAKNLTALMTNKGLSGIEFSLADDLGKGKVNDAISRWNDDAEVTFDASGRPSSKIYFAFMAGQNTEQTIPVTLTYTDGTTAVKTLWTPGYYSGWQTKAQNFVGTSGCPSYTALQISDEGKAEYIQTYKTKSHNQVGTYNETTGKWTTRDVAYTASGAYQETDEDKFVTQNYGGLQSNLSVSYVEVDANKVVSKITLGAASRSDTVVAIYAATEAALTNEELQAAIPSDLSAATDEQISFAYECANELVARGDTTDYSAITTEYKKRLLHLEAAPTQYDLILPYDTDYVAKVGDEVDPATWVGGSLSANWSYSEIYPLDGDSTKLTSGTWTADGIIFKLSDNEASGKGLDSIKRFREKSYTDSNGTKITIPADTTVKNVAGSGKLSSAVYFGFESYGKPKLTVNVTYTDGTTDVFTPRLDGYTDVMYRKDDYTADVLYNTSVSYITVADNVVASKNGSTASGVGIVKVDIPDGKRVSNYAIGTVSSAGDTVLYKMAEKPLTNSELMTAVSIDLSTASDDEILFAKEAAKELQERGDTADYSEILNKVILDDVAQYQLDMPLNADFIGYIGDEVNTETWVGGAGDSISNYSGINGNNKYLNASNSSYISPNGITFKLLPETYSGKVLDGYALKKNAEALVVPGSSRPASQLYILYMVEGGSNNTTVTLKYTDGNSENIALNFPNHFYTTATNYSDIVASYSNIGSWMRPTVDVETGKLVDTNRGETDLEVMALTIPENKVVESYSIVYTYGSNLAFLGMTEVALTNDALEKAVSIDLSTATDNQIAFAKECADELVLRGGNEADYKDIYTEYKQIAFNAPVYIDLTQEADTDVIIPLGTEVPEEFAGRNDETVGNDKIYNSNSISESGIVEMVAPKATSETVIEEWVKDNFPSALTGTTFKLSGDFNSVGNDAVLVAKDSETGTTIEFSETEKRKYKDIYFLLDSPNGEQILPLRVNVTINYSDGTATEATTNLFYNTTYHGHQFYAYVDMGNILSPLENNTFGVSYKVRESDGETVTTYDGAKFFASEINPTQSPSKTSTEFTYDTVLENKEIVSVTFMPSSRANYTILGITAIPYTTDELVDTWLSGFDAYVAAGEAVTDENVALVENGAKAGIELYTVRGIDDVNIINEEYYNYAQNMLDKVEEYYGLKDKGFEVTPVINVESGKVTATASVVNNIGSEKTAVIGVAVYDANNKLLNVNASTLYTFADGTTNGYMEISCDDVTGAVSYKAFVWQSLDSMRPIVYTEK